MTLKSLFAKKYLLLSLFILLIASPCFAEQKNIFFLHSYAVTFPWTDQLNSGIEESLTTHPGWVFYTDYMDFSRLGYNLNDQDLYEYLSTKYASVKFNVIFAESSRAARFINTYGEELFGDVPKVLFSNEDLEHKPVTYYLKNQQDIAVAETFRMAVDQNPDKKTLVIIHNRPETVNPELIILQKLADEEGLQTTVLSDFSLDKLYSTIQHLTGNEILFFFPFFYDNTGVNVIPNIVLSKISSFSPSPVYTAWSSFKDTGCTGGVMVDSKRIALEMFRAVDDYFKTGNFQNGYSTNQAYFNWDAIKKFGIRPDTSREDVIYLNKPIPMIKLYFRQIMFGISITLALFLIISLIGLYHIRKTRNKLAMINIELKEAQQKAETLSRHDSLTGLFNRRAMMEVIDYELKRCKRGNVPLSAIIIDIDHFKNINDTRGHEAGDQILQILSSILTTEIRETDIVSRWGGEEFLILTSDTPVEPAAAVAEKLREAVRGFSFPENIAVTISLGVGEYDSSEDFPSLFRRIDAALYCAKNQGRNRVSIAE